MEQLISTYTLEDLQRLCSDFKQPAFRAKQLYQWLYQRFAQSYDEMTNLPASFRMQLAEAYPLIRPKLRDRQISEDGTRKYVLELADSTFVETVAIPSHASKDRLTVCFSTQVGCAMACSFCATGKEGLTRNLSCGEIVDQILFAQQDMGIRVSNVVGMGQGEPFLNYKPVIDALHIINDSQALGIGARHIVLSTCGIIKGIQDFSDELEQFTLAISLHSAVQATRDMLMPAVAKQDLSRLKSALSAYIAKTNRRVTFEYIMIDQINDSEEDLRALISYCQGFLCHINLIPINNIASSPFKPSKQKVLTQWIEQLQKAGIEATIRNSRGSDIAGACGQLKNALVS